MSSPRKSWRASALPRLIGVTRYAPLGTVLAARPLLAAALLLPPGWQRTVRTSVRLALGPEVDDRKVARDYFRRVADLLGYSAAVYHRGISGAGLDHEWLHDPASRERYRTALALGKGALMVGPHLLCQEIMAGSATREFPVTVLARKAPDPDYEALKQRWYSALGVSVVHRPPKNAPGGGLAEVTLAVRALRQGKVLALTPDLIQRPGTGIPVTLFGRRVELPAGAFFLAQRTGAPLLPSFCHREAECYRLWCHDPLEPMATGDRDAILADMAQRWTDLFEGFLHDHPEMWQFWLDKKWRRWLAETPVTPG